MPYGIISVLSGTYRELSSMETKSSSMENSYHIEVGDSISVKRLPFSFFFLTGRGGHFLGVTEDDQVYFLRYIGDAGPSEEFQVTDVREILLPTRPCNFKVLPLSGQGISKIALGRNCFYFLKEGEIYRTRLSRTKKAITMKIHSPRDVRIIDVQTTYWDIYYQEGFTYFLSSTDQVLVECGLHMKLLPSLNEIKQIACGNEHALFLDYDGNIYGLGKNSHGQLGAKVFRQYESTLAEALIKKRRKARKGETSMKIPIGDLKARSIYAKENTSYFLTYDGELYVIGDLDEEENGSVSRVQGVGIIDDVFTGHYVTFLVSGEEVYSLLDRSTTCTLVEGLNFERVCQTKSSRKNS